MNFGTDREPLLLHGSFDRGSFSGLGHAVSAQPNQPFLQSFERLGLFFLNIEQLVQIGDLETSITLAGLHRTSVQRLAPCMPCLASPAW